MDARCRPIGRLAFASYFLTDFSYAPKAMLNKSLYAATLYKVVAMKQ